MTCCIPQSTASLIRQVAISDRHPGLQLDKFGEPGDQEQQKEVLESVCNTASDPTLLGALLARRAEELKTLQARVWQCVTSAALTLHLSRSSALENAGICLHPVYGFVYLPGSGLKGMAHAFAETVWLPAQSDKRAAWQTIEDVFGWAPNPLRQQQIKDPDHPAEKRYEVTDDGTRSEIRASSGSIVFHDAWPEKWPKLFVDIVNNHHANYYTGVAAPGDWEDPVPVYFLATGPGNVFSFAVSKRQPNGDDGLLTLAQEWLTGALCHLGAGAKTAAGYGTFKPVEGQPLMLKSPHHRTFETTLELVTPAFLAGASQQAEDCDLRPATLRGQLRWWWRTLHAGHVDVDTLRDLEAAVWGSTNAGSPVRLTAEKHERPPAKPHEYDKRAAQDRLRALKRATRPATSRDRTIPGLWYLSYGMDEGGKMQIRRRWCSPPGAKWTVRLTTRDSFYERRNREGEVVLRKPCPADAVLGQARAALWLLAHFGGVGSKARKGFGSLVDVEGLTVEECERIGRELRDLVGISLAKVHTTESPTIEEMLHLEIHTSWKDPWFALDQVGESLQAFVKQLKADGRSQDRIALGLPRKIGRIERECPKGKRFASPVHYHLAKGRDNTLTVRISAFPAMYLPDLPTSQNVLEYLRRYLGSDLRMRAQEPPPAETTEEPVTRIPGRQLGHRDSRHPGPEDASTPGVRIRAVLLEQKTKKGGWMAKHPATGQACPIVNTQDVPASMKPGDQVELTVHSANAFRWPTQADHDRAQKQRPSQPRPGHGFRRPGPPQSR